MQKESPNDKLQTPITVALVILALHQLLSMDKMVMDFIQKHATSSKLLVPRTVLNNSWLVRYRFKWLLTLNHIKWAVFSAVWNDVW
jgi:hypothetical protein